MVKAVLEAKVDGLGRILRADAPFDDALVMLKEKGIEYPVRTRDLAYARIQKGKRNSLSQNGSYTREGFLYAVESPVLLILDSPLLIPELARDATEANRKGNYFSTEDRKVYDKASAQAEKDKDKDPQERGVLILPSRDNFSISKTENFEVLQGLLKDQAEAYLEFNEQDIPVYLVNKSTVDSQSGTLMTQLWFWNLGSWSELNGGRGLGCNDGVRGVQVITGEASSQKISRGYDPRKAKQYLEILQGVREGRLPASRLDKLIADFKGRK